MIFSNIGVCARTIAGGPYTLHIIPFTNSLRFLSTYVHLYICTWALTEGSIGIADGSSGVVEAQAGNICFFNSKQVITDIAPHSIVHDLQSPNVWPVKWQESHWQCGGRNCRERERVGERSIWYSSLDINSHCKTAEALVFIRCVVLVHSPSLCRCAVSGIWLWQPQFQPHLGWNWGGRCVQRTHC